MEEALEGVAHGFEACDDFKAFFYAFGVMAYILLCGFYLQAALFDEVAYHGYLFYVATGVESCAPLIAPRFDDGRELLFPVAQR